MLTNNNTLQLHAKIPERNWTLLTDGGYVFFGRDERKIRRPPLKQIKTAAQEANPKCVFLPTDL